MVGALVGYRRVGYTFSTIITSKINLTSMGCNTRVVISLDPCLATYYIVEIFPTSDLRMSVVSY